MSLTTFVVTIFVLVYFGMLLGRLPWLQLDRTGIALLGAIALFVGGAMDREAATRAVDLGTLALLFGLMVVSAQLRLGGFYAWVTRRLASHAGSPGQLLGQVVLAAALLSAVFSNDVVCLAMAPVVIELCRDRRLDPTPFLLALVCASNVGSAATLIGNPQIMLLGQGLDLPFARYLLWATPPSALASILVWCVVERHWRGRFAAPGSAPVAAPRDDRPLDTWQTAKGLAVVSTVMVLFLFSPLPREAVALAAAGVLLASRKLHSRDMLGQVDWQLLVLFVGLFVVNGALESTGVPGRLVEDAGAAGVDLRSHVWLFPATVVLSNTVSNVPAVMMLLPLASGLTGGLVLGLVSTFAGNLLLIGSIANLIVVDAARRYGLHIGWREHARVGVPVTLLTLALAAATVALADWWLG